MQSLVLPTRVCCRTAATAVARAERRSRYTSASCQAAIVERDVVSCQHGDANQSPTSVYIHLPFCSRKCFYCDFPVEALGRQSGGTRAQQRMQEYVDTLCTEIRATQWLGEAPLQTVYFGGGTPSLVPPHLIQRILSELTMKYGIAQGAEVSMEADPGTFDRSKLSQYLELGVTRVSLGVQAFQEEHLKACGRAHTLSDTYSAIETLKSSGVASWSLDLISGLPRLTPDDWQHSLNEAVAAGPDHVSVYDLQVESGTPFARWYTAGSSPLPQDTEAAAMYAAAVLTLRRAGFEHYEVSNYAKQGHRSRHNQVYWQGAPYYAFGMGAASYLQGGRFTRPGSMKSYVTWVQGLTEGQQVVPGSELPQESQEDRMLDSVMLRLRTADGLDLNSFSQLYGQEAAQLVVKALQPHIQRGHAQLVTGALVTGAVKAGAGEPEGAVAGQQQGPQRVRLTDPHGFLVSNSIISDVFAALSELPSSL